MPGRYWGEGRGSRGRREYWREGEDIRSEPREERERYTGTRDMDFGGGYGGGRDRGADPSWYERGGPREYLGGRRDMDDRWDRDRWDRERWDRGGWDRGWDSERAGSRGGGSWGGGDDDWRRREAGGEWRRDAWGPGGAAYGGGPGARGWRGESRSLGDERWSEPRQGEVWRGSGEQARRGPKGYKRSDDRIREDVCERIARGPVNAEDVEVQVENGEVTLSGEVDERADKRRLEDLIDDIFGVEEVHDHLRLRREAQATARSGDDAHGESRHLPH